jgi:hypothetical protein
MKTVLLSNIQNRYPDATGSLLYKSYRKGTSDGTIEYTGLYPELESNTAIFDLKTNTLRMVTGDFQYQLYANVDKLIPVEISNVLYPDFELPVVTDFIVRVVQTTSDRETTIGVYTSDRTYFDIQVAIEQNNPYFIYNLLKNGLVTVDLTPILTVVDQFNSLQSSYQINDGTYNFLTKSMFSTGMLGGSSSPMQRDIDYTSIDPVTNEISSSMYTLNIPQLIQWIAWICTNPNIEEIQYNNVIPFKTLKLLSV